MKSYSETPYSNIGECYSVWIPESQLSARSWAPVLPSWLPQTWTGKVPMGLMPEGMYHKQILTRCIYYGSSITPFRRLRPVF